MPENPDHASTTSTADPAAAPAVAGKAAGGAGGSRVFSRRIAPFLPAAIGIAAQALMSTGPTSSAADVAAVCSSGVDTFEECHSEYPAGCGTSTRFDAFLNSLKNLDVAPAKDPARFLTSEQDFATLEQNTPQSLGSLNHEQLKDELAASPLGEGEVVGLVGYLYYVKPGGKESSNCELDGEENIDYHIGIGFDSGLAAVAAQSRAKKLDSAQHSLLTHAAVIVEMTPHWRAAHHPEWDLAMLGKVVGSQVRVVGQLLVDNEHFLANADCGRADAKKTCWRASVWELHPVTRFEVCSTGNDCTEGSDDWVSLEKAEPAAAAAVAAPAAATAPPEPANAPAAAAAVRDRAGH